VWRPTLEHFVLAAAHALQRDPDSVRAAVRVALAESALAAPFAGFGAHEQYPTLAEKAAVLIERVVRNHPLPDGNKRTAFILGVTLCELNGLHWQPERVEDDAALVERIAAGEASQAEVLAWVQRRTR
jgi:death on curing protein